ncbi:Uncharacterised protein [Providencia stuartii]|nr:Uncharacterised protein [Providencia stuartii]
MFALNVGFKPLAGEDIEVDDSRNIKKMSKKPKAYTQQDKQSFLLTTQILPKHSSY